jgi:hypothetical protein
MKNSTLRHLAYLDTKYEKDGLNNHEMSYYNAVSKIFMKRINNILKYGRK